MPLREAQANHDPAGATHAAGPRGVFEEIKAARALHRRVLACCAQWAQQVKERSPLGLWQAEVLGAQIAQSAARGSDAALFVSQVDNDFSYSHFFGAASVMAIMARCMEMPQAAIEQAATAGLLHDVGQLLVDQLILNKSGPLTYPEVSSVREHVKFGAALLDEARLADPQIRHVVLHHHERLDGSGYPDGLKRDELPPLTRMMAVADAYDAMGRDRTYRRAMRSADVIAILSGSPRGGFDARYLEVLERCLGPAPAGSLVQLKSGRLALVVSTQGRAAGRPLVAVFYDTAHGPVMQPELVDLASASDDAVMSVEAAGDWGIDVREHLQDWPPESS